MSYTDIFILIVLFLIPFNQNLSFCTGATIISSTAIDCYIHIATHGKMIHYQLTSSSQHGSLNCDDSADFDSSFVTCTNFYEKNIFVIITKCFHFEILTKYL